VNWGGISVLIGLLVLAYYTLPWGLAIIAGLAWLYHKS
jgi:hypothetical protein